MNFAKWLNFAKYLGSKVPTFLDVRLVVGIILIVTFTGST